MEAARLQAMHGGMHGESSLLPSFLGQQWVRQTAQQWVLLWAQWQWEQG